MERRITRSISRDHNLSQLQRGLRQRNNNCSSARSTPEQNSPILKSAKGSSKNDLKYWEDDNLSIHKISYWGETEESFENGSSICDRTIYPSSSNNKEFTDGNILDESFYDEIYSPVACGELFLDAPVLDQFSDLYPEKASKESSGLTLTSSNDFLSENNDPLKDDFIYQDVEMSSSLPKQTFRNLNKLKPKYSLPNIKTPSCPTLRSHTKKSHQTPSHLKLT